jgi:hypothetical protein
MTNLTESRQVAADHTIEGNAWRTWEAWDEARQRRRQPARAS